MRTDNPAYPWQTQKLHFHLDFLLYFDRNSCLSFHFILFYPALCIPFFSAPFFRPLFSTIVSFYVHVSESLSSSSLHCPLLLFLCFVIFKLKFKFILLNWCWIFIFLLCSVVAVIFIIDVDGVCLFVVFSHFFYCCLSFSLLACP